MDLPSICHKFGAWGFGGLVEGRGTERARSKLSKMRLASVLLELPPQKALRGGIPGSFLEPLARSWSHFVGDVLPKVDKLCSNLTSEIPPRRALRGTVGDSRLMRRGTTLSRGLSRRGAARAEDAQGTPTQSHISPSILAYEDRSPLYIWRFFLLARQRTSNPKS